MKKIYFLFLFLFVLFAGSFSIIKKQKQAVATSDTLSFPKNPAALYFPAGTYHDTSKGFDPFMNKWYSKMLFALHEPFIYEHTGTLEVYRFTWLRTFHNPVAVRIEKNGDNYTLTWKCCSGAGGYEAGALTVNKHKEVDAATWNEFQKKLAKSGFRSLTTNSEKARGMDGSEWILEGLSNANYHVVTRWTPHGGSYYNCCNFLLGLSDLVIDKKDKY